VPDAHSEHVSPSRPEEPALQVQAESMMLPEGESAFAGQLLHFVFPLFTLYVPSTHLVHGPPLGPVEPALQVQAVFSLLASGASESVGHPWHKLNVAPTDVEY